MNNMQKAFDKKSALRRIHMADGGLVDKAKQDLGNRAATIDAAASGVPTPKPAPAPAPKPAQPSEDAQRAAVGMAPKKGFLRSLLGMAEGGHVRGPGGPREDKVPAMLSNGEYVLPAKTVQKLGGPEELDELVRGTNEGREPSQQRSGLRHLAGGGGAFLDPERFAEAARQRAAGAMDFERAPQQPPRYPQTPQQPAQGAMNFERVTPNGPSPTTGNGAMNYERINPNAGAEAAAANANTAKNAAATAATTTEAVKPSMLRSIAGGAGNLAKSFIGGAGGAIGATTGAVQSYNDIDNGYRDKFNESVDATSPLGTAGADTLRTFGNVGNALTFGLAGKLGQGISSAVNGGSFSDGFSGPTDRDAFLAAKEAPKPTPGSVAGNGGAFGPPGNLSSSGVPTDAAPSPRSLAQSRYLSEQGVDVATQDSAPVAGDLRGLKTDPGKFLNLGSFQGPDNIYGTSSKPGGRVNSFVGAGDPNRQESQQTQDAVAKLQNDLAADKVATAQKAEQERLNRAAQGNSGAINARFNDMASKVQGSYSAKGKGNESKRLLEIEAQRNNALEADARNTTSIRGQTLQAQNNSAENVLKGKQIDSQAASHAATLRAQSAPKPVDPIRARELLDKEAQTVRSNEEKGADAVSKAVNTSVERRFPDAKKTGSPDGAKAVDYQNFFNHPGNEALVGKIRTGTPTESAEALTTLDRLYDQRNKVNERGSSSLRGNTSLGPVTAIGPSRDVEFGDYWGQGSLPASQILRRGAAVFNADAGKVQKMSNGQLVPLNDLTNDSDELISNGKNFDKVKSVELQRRVASPRALTDREVEAEARRKQLESIIKR